MAKGHDFRNFGCTTRLLRRGALGVAQELHGAFFGFILPGVSNLIDGAEDLPIHF